MDRGAGWATVHGATKSWTWILIKEKQSCFEIKEAESEVHVKIQSAYENFTFKNLSYRYIFICVKWHICKAIYVTL